MNGTSDPFCNKCGKPYTYVGDVPQGGYPQGQAPWCECGRDFGQIILPTNWKYCPHCGKELK